MDTAKIQDTIETLLHKLLVSFISVEGKHDYNEGILSFVIKTNEPDVLIGRDGTTLLALNHLVHRLTEKDFGEHEKPHFIIDVNGYQKNKIEELRQKANMIAERVRFFKNSIELEPMSSYERMIVHTHLLSFQDIATESVGVGDKRRIVVRYTEKNSPKTT